MLSQTESVEESASSPITGKLLLVSTKVGFTSVTHRLAAVCLQNLNECSWLHKIIESKIFFFLLKATDQQSMAMPFKSLWTLTAFFSSVQNVCQCASSTPQSNLRAPTAVQNVARRCDDALCVDCRRFKCGQGSWHLQDVETQRTKNWESFWKSGFVHSSHESDLLTHRHLVFGCLYQKESKGINNTKLQAFRKSKASEFEIS